MNVPIFKAPMAMAMFTAYANGYAKKDDANCWML